MIPPGYYKVQYCDPERHMALLVNRPDVAITVDCREAFTDPTAHARLIAAAPMLLEALKDTAHSLKKQINKGVGGLRISLDIVEAAIARAEQGDTP